MGGDLEDRVRAYLGALLPAGEVPAALEAALADDAPFDAAHRIVHERVRVTTEVEIDVLVHDAGLTVEEAAHVARVGEDDAREAVAAVAAAAEEIGRRAPRAPIVIVDDSGEPLVLPEGTTRRRRWPWLVAVTLTAIAIAGLVLTYGDDPCDSTVHDVPDAPLTVERACVTHQVDAEGRPVAPRHTFAAGEPVTFWFAYDLRGNDDFLLTLVVSREGEEVPNQPQFPPPDNCDGPCGQAHVTIPSDLVEDVGTYTVEVRWEGETLAAGDFAVVRATE